jgi:hypothetical protein
LKVLNKIRGYQSHLEKVIIKIIKTYSIMKRDRETTADKQVNTKTKMWLKHHSKDYLEERKKYAEDPDVKERRNILSRSRRAGSSAAVNTFKKFGPLTDSHGNSYEWRQGRVCKNKKEVVRRGKNGVIYYMPYSDEDDLKDPKYDAPIITDEDKKLYQTVKKLFDGDESIEQIVKQTKIVVAKELSDEDCFWKNLSQEEKEKILRKLKPPPAAILPSSSNTNQKEKNNKKKEE